MHSPDFGNPLLFKQQYNPNAKASFEINSRKSADEEMTHTWPGKQQRSLVSKYLWNINAKRYTC